MSVCMNPYFCSTPDSSYSFVDPYQYTNPYFLAPFSHMYYPAQTRLLEMILEGISDEIHDRTFYEYLATLAPNNEQREIIQSIANDEAKHLQMFRNLYREITGYYPNPTPLKEIERTNYVEGIERSIFGELKAVEFYRQIYFLLNNMRQRDMLFEIITDEQKHATKWNYLYTKNT